MKFIFAGKEHDIDVKYYVKMTGLMLVALVGITIFDLAGDQTAHDPEYVYSVAEQVWQTIGLLLTYAGFAAVGYIIRKKEEKDD